jgi:hypothetical protein
MRTQGHGLMGLELHPTRRGGTRDLRIPRFAAANYVAPGFQERPARQTAPPRFRLAGLALGLLLAAAGVLTAFEDQTASRLPVDSGRLYAATAVDIDGNRDADLVLATQAGLRLLLNNGVGVFSDVTAARLPSLTDAFLGIAAGDVDHDGDLDLFAASADGAAGC